MGEHYCAWCNARHEATLACAVSWKTRADALTAPLSADREAEAALAEMGRVLGEALKGRTHDVWHRAWSAGFRDARDILSRALTAPRGAGEGIEDIGLSSETRPQPSSKAELQEPCDLEGWRPIESAPRDGTPILLWSAWGQGIASNHWAAEFTHWRPLPPAPPSAPSAGGR